MISDPIITEALVDRFSKACGLPCSKYKGLTAKLGQLCIDLGMAPGLLQIAEVSARIARCADAQRLFDAAKKMCGDKDWRDLPEGVNGAISELDEQGAALLKSVGLTEKQWEDAL